MCKGLRTPRWKQSEYRMKIQGVRFASERFYQNEGESTEEMWIDRKFQVLSSRNVQSARAAFASTEAVDYISTKGGGQFSSKNHIKWVNQHFRNLHTFFIRILFITMLRFAKY